MFQVKVLFAKSSIAFASIVIAFAITSPPAKAQGFKSIELLSKTYPAGPPIFGRDTSNFRPNFSTTVNVNNPEELYFAINNPSNAGSLIVMAPGTYMLSANDTAGVPRPNGGRIDLLENMSLQGVIGDRTGVVIDAINLPAGSYSTPLIAKSGAIRMGRGVNSVEWLTIRNAVNGNGGIETDIVWPGIARLRIAHIVSTGNTRGIDLRNLGSDQAGRVIEAEIVDNDLYNNQLNTGLGLRIANTSGSQGGMVTAMLSGNRVHNNLTGLVVEGVNTSLGRITVFSYGDRFYANNLGAAVGGGLSLGANGSLSDGNITNFTAYGSFFENNGGDGLALGAGATTSFPNAASNNTVYVSLLNCRLAANQSLDLYAAGAESTPESLGPTGTNNSLILYGRGISPKFRSEFIIGSIPEFSGSMNTATFTSLPW